MRRSAWPWNSTKTANSGMRDVACKLQTLAFCFFRMYSWQWQAYVVRSKMKNHKVIPLHGWWWCMEGSTRYSDWGCDYGWDVYAHTFFVISQSHSVEIALNRRCPVLNWLSCTQALRGALHPGGEFVRLEMHIFCLFVRCCLDLNKRHMQFGPDRNTITKNTDYFSSSCATSFFMGHVELRHCCDCNMFIRDFACTWDQNLKTFVRNLL